MNGQTEGISSGLHFVGPRPWTLLCLYFRLLTDIYSLKYATEKMLPYRLSDIILLTNIPLTKNYQFWVSFALFPIFYQDTYNNQFAVWNSESKLEKYNFMVPNNPLQIEPFYMQGSVKDIRMHKPP